MVASRHGLIIYGGITWPEVDMGVADKIRAEKELYNEACGDIIETLVLKN